MTKANARDEVESRLLGRWESRWQATQSSREKDKGDTQSQEMTGERDGPLPVGQNLRTGGCIQGAQGRLPRIKEDQKPQIEVADKTILAQVKCKKNPRSISPKVSKKRKPMTRKEWEWETRLFDKSMMYKPAPSCFKLSSERKLNPEFNTQQSHHLNMMMSGKYSHPRQMISIRKPESWPW